MTPRGGSTPEEVANSESLLAGFFDEVLARFKVEPGNCLLLGFSQGGGMTYRCGLGRADTFAGLAALSATLPGADELDHRLPAERTQPIFVAHGRYDQMIAESTAHAAKDYLENAGYSPEFHVYDMGHEISGEVIRDLVAWMNKRAAAAGDALTLTLSQRGRELLGTAASDYSSSSFQEMKRSTDMVISVSRSSPSNSAANSAPRSGPS